MPFSRREFLVLSSGAAVYAVAPWRAALGAQAPQASPPATAFETIRRNVGSFTGRGGTIGWMSNRDALIVIDTQFPDTAKVCLDGLRARASRGPDIVFNTHHHGDHTAGNTVFKGVAKRIVAHARVPALQRQAAEGAQPPTVAEQVYADATFEDTWSETFGDEQVTARHHGPGHTGGDAVIHFERAQVVHMGDLLFHERHPFVDRPAGASIQNWMKTLEIVLKQMPADTRYIAGHVRQGLPVVVQADALRKQRDYFDAVLAHVRKGMAAGSSKEEVTKLETLSRFEGYQAAPPRLTLASVLGVAYDELSAK
ncbi:MAG TPA: MBL fold metallo-hydrolase [Vicinamibacterales bacterium]|nr:MBL fold metallo-hydrolase [Vicinamibacterales bacterium]